MAISLATTLLLPLSAGADGKPGYGCAPGFDLGAVTIEQTLALPRIQAGLQAGAYDAALIESLFESIDHNGDDLICLQDIGALNGVEHWQFLYNGVDNNASAPG